MKFEKFEDIIAWQKAGALTMETYKVFKDCNDFGFLNQIRRAVISIMNNIAEGYERNTNKDFKNFITSYGYKYYNFKLQKQRPYFKLHKVN